MADNQLQTTRGAGGVQRIGFARLDAPITQIQTLVDRINELKSQAFILCPFTSLDMIPANFQVSERVVILDTNPKAHDVYGSSFTKSDVALAKNGILKLWAAAGGSVLWSKQMDDRSHPLVIEWSCMLELRQIDGNVVQYPGSKRIDLRDESPEYLAMCKDGDPKQPNVGQIAGARQHIVAMAESKALLRAIRGILALNQTYSPNDLRTKPFVCYTLTPVFDMSDPVTRQLVTASLLGPALYAQTVRDLAAASQSGETRVVEGQRAIDTTVVGSTDAAQTGAQVSSQPAASTTPQAKAGPPPEDEEATQDTRLLCACPHGANGAPCNTELTEDAFSASMGRVGTARCSPCYPGQHFSFEQHKHLTTLGLPKWEHYTPEDARDRRAELEKAKVAPSVAS